MEKIAKKEIDTNSWLSMILQGRTHRAVEKESPISKLLGPSGNFVRRSTCQMLSIPDFSSGRYLSCQLLKNTLVKCHRMHPLFSKH